MQEELAELIAEAARQAFSDLFARHPGHYYYCALVTTGEAHAPVVSAWSYEALDAALAGETNPEEARLALKWSYADSPYHGFGNEYFATVNALFSARPRLTSELSSAEWAAEYQLRLDAMEAAMARIDTEGLFGVGGRRLEMVAIVEVAPPDHTNTERAVRLNPPEALKTWLKEAGEE